MKIKNKYYLFKYKNNNIKLVVKSSKMLQLKEKIIGMKLSPDNEFILLKLSKEPKFNENAVGLNKMIGGPIKITCKILYITENSILHPKYEKIPNKSGEYDMDKRNAQFVFIPLEWYNIRGIKTSDMMKLAHLMIENKLEKRPLAPKLISQIE